MKRKICCRCNANKPLNEFHKNSRAKDGLQYHCKECHYEIKRKRKRPPKEDIPKDTKRCTACNKIKPLTEFHKANSYKSCRKEVRGKCKECSTQPKVRLPEGHKRCVRCTNVLPLADFHWKEKGKRRVSKCKECLSELYREQNQHRQERKKRASTDTSKECSKCGWVLNRERYFTKKKDTPDGYDLYCKGCKKEIREESDKRIHKQERLKKNRIRYALKKNKPQFKLQKNLRNQFRKALISQSLTKDGSVINLIGCSIIYLKNHLETQFTPEMTWENYGSYWTIDHKRPVTSFDLSTNEEQNKCWHYTNLQPMKKEDNAAKGAKWET